MFLLLFKAKKERRKEREGAEKEVGKYNEKVNREYFKGGSNFLKIFDYIILRQIREPDSRK